MPIVPPPGPFLMLSAPAHQRAFAASVAAIAGYVDVTGFLAMNGYFVSFMSGNSTRLAVALSSDLSAIGMPFALIAAFVSGVFAGELAGRRSLYSRAHAVLGLATAALFAAALLGTLGSIAIGSVMASFAMGASNRVYDSSSQLPVGLTYMTGTLVGLGKHLALKFAGDPGATPSPYLLHWLALVSGGVLGAVVSRAFGLVALWPAVVCTALLAILSWVRKEGDGRP